MLLSIRTFGRLICTACIFQVLIAQSLQITSPANGTVVTPGQNLAVSVTATGGPFQEVIVVGFDPIGMTEPLTAPPYNFTIQIPVSIRPDKYLLTASGLITPGQVTDSKSIVIIVEPPEDLTALSIQPNSVTVWVGDVAPLRVVGKFAGGVERTMTFSSKISYGSSDPTIATIDNMGRITGMAPGTTVVGVNGYRIPVTVADFIKIVPASAILYGGQSVDLGAQVRIAAGQSVTWSVNPNTGTLSGIGPNIATYTAPATITTQQQVTLTATSTADPTKSATATITLYPPLSVPVSPTNASLRASQTQQFTGSVANATYPGVTWSSSPAGVGTITTGGLYTAPSSIAADQTISVKATSNQDPSKTASVNVTLKKSR